MTPLYQETDEVIEVTPNGREQLIPAQFHWAFFHSYSLVFSPFPKAFQDEILFLPKPHTFSILFKIRIIF